MASRAHFQRRGRVCLALVAGEPWPGRLRRPVRVPLPLAVGEAGTIVYRRGADEVAFAVERIGPFAWSVNGNGPVAAAGWEAFNGSPAGGADRVVLSVRRRWRGWGAELAAVAPAAPTEPAAGPVGAGPATETKGQPELAT
jgi:hypothetical protein